MTEQELYRSILQKMLDQTEQHKINNSQDFIKQLTNELKQSNVFTKQKNRKRV
ncbi:hypothetical protein [Gracilibacillus sp. YIM 98692]|uniref:hypothetical protein n=1 Tax=Gracilibacillus sp. YIM 98692 TaxID=2663532 RepID=UPI0013D3E52B|nr:hypothetical protein [Gracilibacillus sp. YIM 98692]